MNEFKRCIRVFSHSPFKVRLMLISMLCDMINSKPEKDKPSENYCGVAVRRFFFLPSSGYGGGFRPNNPSFCQFCHVPHKTISL